MNYSSSPIGAASQGIQSGQYGVAVDKPPQPTRFSQCAGQLEARVAHVAGLFDRVSRVADRFGGSVPEEAQAGKQLQGTGGNVASIIEQSLETLDAVIRRAERTVERLESL